jgi:hypothetical protein
VRARIVKSENASDERKTCRTGDPLAGRFQGRFEPHRHAGHRWVANAVRKSRFNVPLSRRRCVPLVKCGSEGINFL